jgi:pyrimidine-specific ribonucleoside hydrolase
MRSKCLLSFVVLLLLSPQLATAHGEGHTAVIVDTDAALDDIRALALLVQSPDVDVIAVVTSDGACAPGAGARNVRTTLDSLGWANVPVAPGSALNLPSPPWRKMSESLGWSGLAAAAKVAGGKGRNQRDDELPGGTATGLIRSVVRERESGIIYICLGPLTNLAEALLADSTLAGRITAVYYSGSAPGVSPPSWNTSRDTAAAATVFERPFPVFAFQVREADLLAFNRDLMDAVCDLETPAAELLCRLHGDPRVLRLVQSEHFRCWDEMVILGFLYPELCIARSTPDRLDGGSVTRFDRTAAGYRYLTVLSGEAKAKTGERTPVVLARYPTEPELLRDDVRPLAAAIVERHGVAEWNAALLANEFHRHLGIYSIVGVKMGIRAREILDAGVDDLRVISHSGSRPPLSCLSDGLQVATGASLGRGMISVDPDEVAPAAIFIRGNARLRLRLKADISARIETDIEGAIRRFGALTPAYWRAVRELSLRYWLELDRREIFDESFLDESGADRSLD